MKKVILGTLINNPYKIVLSGPRIWQNAINFSQYE